MKRAGIIGGLGPESTVDYYQSFIHKYQERMNSKQTLPELFINSINMYTIFQYISEGKINDLIDFKILVCWARNLRWKTIFSKSRFYQEIKKS